jgi:hypothetical protein
MRSRRLQWNDTGAIRNSLTFWNRLALFVHLFLFVLVAGVFWGTWFSLSRSMSSITAPTFLEIGRTMIANLGGPMAVLMPATLLWRCRRWSGSIAYVGGRASL